VRASILAGAALVSVGLSWVGGSSVRADDGLEGAASLEFHVAHTDMFLGDASFDGTGADSAGYVRSFSADGAALGVVKPRITFYDVAVAIHIGGEHEAQYVVTILGGGGTSSADATPTDPAVGDRVDRDLKAARGGLEIGVGTYVGPLPLYVQATTFFGVASVWTSVHDLSGCALRGCTGDATAAHGYVQPRATLQLELPLFTLGAYVGDNLLHPEEIETGLTLGVRFWSARAKSDFDVRELLHF
jgi:hypothetical protein